jgi:hypothetical protein
MNNLVKLLTIGVLVAVVAGVCGCTNPVQTVQNAVTPTNKALDYANALLALTNGTLKPNQTVVNSKVIANGSDGARVTYTMEDTTKNGLWANGTSTTVSGSVKQYSSKDEATKAFDDVSFGYTPGKASDIANMTNPANDTYLKAFGHKATINNQATKIDNLSFVSVSGSMAEQQDEIVTTVTISAMPKQS